MNPKAEIFFDAVTNLREDLVEEAQDYRFHKRRGTWKKFGSLAACLMLIASLSLLTLPRGCGGAAPDNGSVPPALADSCAPGDGSALGEALPELDQSVQEPDAPAESPEGSYGQAERWQLEAEVVEIREASLLVETENGLLTVLTEGLELPELAVGDEVRIICDSRIREGDPPCITDAAAIERREEE